MSISFELLSEHPQYIQQIRALYWAEWADSLKKELDVQNFEEYQLSSDIKYYVALQNQQLVGTIGLAPLDLHRTDPCAHLTPWLSYVCILPEYRNQKLATQMVQWFIHTVSARPLYLWCKHSLMPFYARFGFELIESRSDISIMALNV